MGTHAPPALPRRVVPVRRLPRHVLAPAVLAVPVGPADLDVPRLVVRVDPVRLVAIRHRRGNHPHSKHRRSSLVRCRPAGRLVLAVPVAEALVAPVAPVAPVGRVVLVAVAPVDLAAAVQVAAVQVAVAPAAPAAGSHPASPARVSHPSRRRPRRRPPQRHGDAAAP